MTNDADGPAGLAGTGEHVVSPTQIQQTSASPDKYGAPSPIDIFIITNLETLRIVSDPLRLRILNYVRPEARTAKEIAAELDMPVTRVYYHLGLLEAHNLVRVTETRVVFGIVEKHYQATSRKLSVDHALFQQGDPTADRQEGLDVFLSAVLDYTRSDILQGVQSGLIDPAENASPQQALLLGRSWARLSFAQIADFRERLIALVKEFKQMQSDSEEEPAGETRWYELLTGLYPTRHKADRFKESVFSATEASEQKEAEKEEPER